MLRWQRVAKRPNVSNSAINSPSALPAIRMQVLIYPGLQFVNSTTSSFTTQADVLQGRMPFCRVWTWIASPERTNDPVLIRMLCAGNHTTRATRKRLEHYFHFGPPDGSEDEVTSDDNFETLYTVQSTLYINIGIYRQFCTTQ